MKRLLAELWRDSFKSPTEAQMSALSDESTPRRRSLTMWVAAAAGLLVLLPVMYVGLFWAALWLVHLGWISESAAKWVGVVFIPLELLVAELPVLETALEACLAWPDT